jgi:hypothetical protein
LGELAFHWGKSGMGWMQGDFGGDGVVNSADLGDLATHWGWSAPDFPAPGPEQPLPEPVTLVFLSAGGLLLFRRRPAARQKSSVC